MASKSFKTIDAMERALYSIGKEAMEATLEILLDKLIEIIDENVYQAIDESENGEYVRTEDLKKIWGIGGIKAKKGYIEGTISPYLGEDMTYRGRPFYQHVSPNLYKLNIQEYIDVIENGWETSMFGESGNRPPRPFFKEWENWVKDNYVDIYKAEFEKRCL